VKKAVTDNKQSYSLKELDNLKQQWENLPVFVKKYIKQLEGDVIKLQVKLGFLIGLIGRSNWIKEEGRKRKREKKRKSL